MKSNFLTLILLFFLTSPLTAQEIAVPVPVQVSLFSKILSYDRNLETRAGKEIILGVVFQSRFKRSLNVKDDFITAMNENKIKTIKKIPLRVIPIDIYDTDLAKTIEQFKINVLYVTPLRAVDIASISSISQTKKIMTLTGVPEYSNNGISVSIGLKGEKPLIIINIKAAKAENIDFGSQLLKLAKVIQ